MGVPYGRRFTARVEEEGWAWEVSFRMTSETSSPWKWAKEEAQAQAELKTKIRRQLRSSVAEEESEASAAAVSPLYIQWIFIRSFKDEKM